jgi:hypothetical protein
MHGRWLRKSINLILGFEGVRIRLGSERVLHSDGFLVFMYSGVCNGARHFLKLIFPSKL